MIRVALVDDQIMIRDGFARMVRAQADMELVALGANGRDAVRIANEFAPNVMVVDIRMPVLDGISATRQILAAASEFSAASHDVVPRILIVTTFNLDEYVFEALRAGASGFLLKDSTPEQLLGAIRTIAAGDALVDPTVTRALIGAFADRIRAPRGPDEVADTLTRREREVLRLLAAGNSNAEIAAEMVVARETAKTYVSRVLLKLGVRDRVQAVVYAYRSGIVDN
jgi:DNA-binding NarL/FixJ family response regulator